MTIIPPSTESLVTAFQNAKDGDTILVTGEHDLTPEIPYDMTNKPTGGAPLALDGKKGIRVVGRTGSILRSTRHGCLIGINNCEDVEISGLELLGNGYYLGQEDWYWAGIFLNGHNKRLKIHHNDCHDFGDHCIAHLCDGSTDDSEFAYNRCERWGFLNHPKIGGDGTGIAVCGSRNWVHHNVFTFGFRDQEEESKYDTHDTFDNVWEDNVSYGTIFNPFMAMPSHLNGERFKRTVFRRNLIVSAPPKEPYLKWNKVHPILVSGGSGYLIEANTIIGLQNDWCAIDITPNHAEIRDVIVRANIISGTGVTGISVGESQGAKDNGVHRVSILDNRVGPVGGRNIWYCGCDHTVRGNTLVKGQWETIWAPDDPGMTCCGGNTVIG